MERMLADRMLATISLHPMACLIGLFGVFCLAIFPLFRSRNAMLSMYIGNNLAFVLHYGLLNEWTAAAMNGVMAVQTLVALCLDPSYKGAISGARIDNASRNHWLYYGLMVLLAIMVALTWLGLPSVFAGMAARFSTLGRLRRRELPLRLLMLLAMPCWLVHGILVGSMPGLTADLLSIAIGRYMLYQRCWQSINIAAPVAPETTQHFAKKCRARQSVICA